MQLARLTMLLLATSLIACPICSDYSFGQSNSFYSERERENVAHHI